MKRKLLSVLLTFCLAFSLLPTAALAEGEEVAQIGETKYATLADAIAAASSGATVTLLADINTPDTSYYIDKRLTIDLKGKTVTGSGYDGVFSITGAGAEVCIKNGAVVAVEKNGDAGKYTMAVWAHAAGCTVTLEALTVSQQINHTDDKQMDMIYASAGTIIINSGSFTSGTPKWTLNIKDGAYKDGSANIIVNGGTFVGYDPRNAENEGEGTSLVAEGVGVDANSDGTFTAKSGMVAQIIGMNGNSKNAFGTLQEAITVAGRKTTVKLLADTKENVTISTSDVTLDLNGYTLNGSTGERKPALTVTAKNTVVKDSSTAQTGTIMREDTAENSGVSSHYVIDVQGSGWLTFESGTVKNGSGAGGTNGASLVRVGDDSVAKYPGLNIKGGTFTQDNFIVIKVDRGDLFLNGGTLNSANSYAVENWHRATIKGGTVNGNVAAWTYSGGSNSDLTISGGTVNGDVESISYDGTTSKKASVSITGGVVNGTLITGIYGSAAEPSKEMATIKVTSGTFKNDPTKYVVEDSAVTKNEDNTYGVAKAYLAQVGENSYYTMDEAFQAQTASREPIVLLRDYTTGSPFNSGSINRTVDLNGHTWTCTGTDANSAAFEINYANASLTVKNGKIVSSQLVGLIPSASGGTIKYDNSSLTFDGVEMTTTATSGIETNGNNTNDSVTLKNSTLNVPNGFGIYFPSSGTLTIDNSTINAKTMGVQVCAGSLSINAGSAITVSGDPVVKTENDGAIQDGAAISIVNRTGYKGLGNITVTGGTFKANGTNAAIKAYDWANKTESDFTASDKVAVSGGYFTSDPSAYVADSYISVTSDKSGYDYMVVEKTDTGSIVVKPAVAEPEVKVSDNIQNKEAVEAAAKTVSAPTLSTAAADEAQKIDEAKATELVAKATDVTGETSTKKLYVQTALKVEPTAYSAENKTLTLDITPQYRVVASTADKADEIKLNGDDKNAQVVQDYQKLTITAPTEISMQLPDGFATAGNKLSIKHIKDNGTVEYYTGTVSEESSKLYVTFTTKGFSPFTISAPAASIGETMYPTLAEAIAKAANGSTIKLEKVCDESVSVSGKSLTIDKNNHVYDFAKVTVDSNSTKTENGGILTITYTAPSYSSGSSSDPTYSVSTPSKTEHGSVTVSPKSASKGDTVTVTVKPDSGYVLETLTVTDKNGNELTLKDKGNGKYTFTMPAGKVEVKATFMEDNSMLNFFYDVPNNAYFYEAVKWAVENGITTGVGNDLFAPEQPCTRAQIVTFLWRAAGSPEPKGAASGMTDVVSGSYYEKAVAWAIENGITTGTTATTFSPDATCTRAQAVTFLARALKAKAASAAEFSDVPTDSYFADAVAWAAANGVTEGIGGGLFGSDNDCTRGQIVTFLYRAYNK